MSEKAIEKKAPLFDRIFKPEHIVLDNGHTVDRPRSRTPLITLVLLVVVIISLQVTDFDFGILIKRGHELGVIMSQIFQPDFSYFPKVVKPLLDTIQMSLLGTVLGCLIALPLAIFASSNICHNKVIVSILRFILAITRSVPTLIIANIFALMYGMGTYAGFLAITIFTIGVVAKMLYESIETIDMKPFEAMTSFGATTLEAFWAACMPQILPTYLSHSLYCFEMNVRASSILGYVGAGGLGLLISERVGWRDYRGLGMVLLSLFVVVVFIDFFSDWLREKLS
ncbi:MAG: phosphonate ABC transporter, permease protein PhnE [Erysipelotrichaceae bacterium]|nr:phosphonate ABC transporter, permease protein PhnE [Lactimicrobium massiliense]MDD6725846.1 phosphonate ABC transporter, permease protein PhnE [Lactimicrobium massiliense]MDY3930491.1 phosphonate ABC transporter, permease protein PhnE [Erysipelotrichaceae bacterium]